jgi:DNA helicase IV
VGDDWQAINRFAGADISIMTSFEQWFGRGPTLRLETTFRCPQEICDVSSHFVSKNPRQLSKAVVSAKEGQGPRVRLIRVPNQEAIGPAVEEYLHSLPKQGRRMLTVDILGRYGFDAEHARPGRRDGVEVTFRTVHGSKGLEADHIVIVRADNGRHGFPSQIADDPMLSLAMSNPDPYPHAEERRLFYVALTRARREVVIITIAGRESPFVVELIQDGLVDEDQLTGSRSAPVRVCPTCGQGTLVKRSGPYGDFLGCSRFPSCRGTAQLGSPF